jgi:dihydroxy-acid dehydratase
LVQTGDRIEIDIPKRSISLAVSDAVLAERRAAMLAKGKGAWKPQPRNRKVSMALRAYAAFTTSAARGAVRNLDRFEG